MTDQYKDVRPPEAFPPLRPRTKSGWFRRPFVWIVVALLAVGVGAWFLRAPPRQAPMGRHGRGSAGGPMTVVTAAVKKGDVDVVLSALGTVTPLANVTVRTQIAGQLTQIGFTEGQMVKKGDFLAEVDPRPYQMALEQAEGQLTKDQALLKNAELDLTRYQTLVAQDSIAKQELDTQAALVEQYRGTVKTDQGVVGNAKLNLAYCHITAPVAGRVGLRQVDQGNYVQTGDTNGIVVLTEINPISVLFTLPEDNLPQVLARVQSGATLQVTAYDRSHAVKLAVGKLATIDNQVDVSTGTVKFRAEFDNADQKLFPNQFVNIMLLVDTQHDTMVVPVSAIQRGAPGTFVYLVNADKTVSIKVVQLGVTNGETQAVASGLAEGDMVVTDGADKLKDGAKVILQQPSGTAPAAQSGKGQKAGQGQHHKHHQDAQ